jgi:DMSO/TMAO reductase YedYZ molybdopterin-dependent catalytic subunit
MDLLSSQAYARSPLNRRAFLHQAAALPLLGTASASLLAAGPEAKTDGLPFPGLIMREREPENLEFPFVTLDRFVTPAERFFVRSHFPTPKLDAKSWRLKVEGAVERPLELSLDELTNLASRTLTATLECAGNGRVFLTPKVRGVAWELGAVGNAEWTGVPLAAVLEKAGVRSQAVEVILEGADEGEVNDDPKSPGRIHFARSLPLAKARKPEVLLAYRMNGAALTPSHGYPLRAVVAGWYGMASIKWLTRLVVTDRPFQGFFQSYDYTYFERRHGLPSMVPITAMEVKAQLARPARGDTVLARSAVRVTGAAWAGESEVAKVEVSSDAGRTWVEAKLLDKPVPFAWRLWEFTWKTPERAGRHTLMVRATDQSGRVQPSQRDRDRRTYLINHLLPVEVEVRER